MLFFLLFLSISISLFLFLLYSVHWIIYVFIAYIFVNQAKRIACVHIMKAFQYEYIFWINRKTLPPQHPFNIVHRVMCNVVWCGGRNVLLFSFVCMCVFFPSSLYKWFLGDSDVCTHRFRKKIHVHLHTHTHTVDNYKLGIKSDRTTSVHR